MQNSKSQVTIYTDGSCLGNPGYGGWAVIIWYNSKEIILKGGAVDTTNNRMEMTAVLEALKWIRSNSKLENIKLCSDSSLVLNSIKKGWKRKKNIDIWEHIDVLNETLKNDGVIIDWQWVKGHSDNKSNEKADKIAVAEATKLKRKFANNKTVNTSKKSNLYRCPKCKIETNGDLSYMPDSKMIRVDCDKCGSYIMFAEQSAENLKRAKKKVLLTKSQLEKIKEIMQSRGKQISENELKKIKKWTRDEAKCFIESEQTLF